MRLRKSVFRSTPYQPNISRLRKILQSDKLPHFFFALAPAENPATVEAEIRRPQLPGTTRDNCLIVLADYFPGSALISEIGTLRELPFRKVGEGNCKRRDLDQYDKYYQHLAV